MRERIVAILAVLLMGTVSADEGRTIYCCDEDAAAAFQAQVKESVSEGFEDWEDTRRFPQSVVESEGITYIRSGAGFKTSVSGGYTHEGDWLMYVVEDGSTYRHPRDDKYTMISENPLYGFGGWFRGSSSDFEMSVDGVDADFTGKLANSFKFFGVISDEPFSVIEVGMEYDPTEWNLFWSDDFTFVLATLPPVDEPPVEEPPVEEPPVGEEDPPEDEEEDEEDEEDEPRKDKNWAKKQRECEEEGGTWVDFNCED
jgi:hypothetical protein